MGLSLHGIFCAVRYEDPDGFDALALSGGPSTLSVGNLCLPADVLHMGLISQYREPYLASFILRRRSGILLSIDTLQNIGRIGKRASACVTGSTRIAGRRSGTATVLAILAPIVRRLLVLLGINRGSIVLCRSLIGRIKLCYPIKL